MRGLIKQKKHDLKDQNLKCTYVCINGLYVQTCPDRLPLPPHQLLLCIMLTSLDCLCDGMSIEWWAFDT